MFHYACKIALTLESALQNWKPTSWFSQVVMLTFVLSLLSSRDCLAQSLFFDDFQSYSVGSNLNGQGGWSGALPLLIGDSTGLNSRVVDAHSYPGTNTFPISNHALPAPINTAGRTLLEFDAYATTNPSGSSVVGFNSIINPIPLNWFEDSENGQFGWSFDARGLLGDNSKIQFFSGGRDAPVHMGLVVDGISDTVYGTYDFGAGTQQTASYAVTNAQIASLTDMTIWVDYRFWPGFVGADVDNLRLSDITQASATPEPGSLALFTGLGFTCIACRLKRRRSRAQA